MGRVRRALSRVRCRVPALGPPRRSRSEISAYPVARISRDAGMYLHWSGDSTRVLWTLGPDLYARDLSRSFTFLESGREKADEPETKGVPIGFTAPRTCRRAWWRSRVRAIVTMAAGGGGGGPTGVIEDGTIVIEGNRIKAVGPPARCDSGRRGAHRRTRRDGHPGDHRRPRARLRRERRHPRRDELVVSGQPRLRRHDVARSVERHRDGVHATRN